MPLTITHDGPLEVATGRNRHETNWKNKTTTWSAVVERASQTHRTSEKYAEYIASTKARQDEIKDSNGAFVGGYLAKGKRGKGSVNYRQLITLDLDFAPQGVWDEFTTLYGCAAAIYSTHKHSVDKPRLRLLIPLDRHVPCDEYVAIARRVAGNIGIEYFDDTTYQPERLMYWPSTSKDGVYEFNFQDGLFLCADEVLASYRDWTDSSEWPVSDRVGATIQREIKKMGDPLEKPGVVGAFCRTHSIHDAIDLYLSDVYTTCDVEGRYTYSQGSTSGGLVTYDDKFAYSHHGTDPVSMRLCNAFDLVRIHRFGLRDENVTSNTPVHRYPSHLAMEELATKDSRVRSLIVGERVQNAQEDFKGLSDDDVTEDTPAEGLGETVETDDKWRIKLNTDKKGNIASTVDNIVILLEYAPELKGRFKFDDFAKRPILVRNTPWRKVSKLTQHVTDKDEDALYHHLERVYGINATKLEKALNCIYLKNSFHPVRDYLETLKWDKVKRCDRLLIDYLGASDSAYTRTVTRKMLVAAVARIYQPGIKFDHVLTTIGPEGTLKSTIFKKLGGVWFTDNFSFGMIKSKEGIEQLQGFWIVEAPEMGGFKKADRLEVKAFISRDTDVCRPAFGRNTVYLPRQSVIVSTSNTPDPLHENEGNRRIWPVDTHVTVPLYIITRDLTPEVVGQLWAEAVTLYRAGETLYLSSEMEKVARDVQQSHTERDDRVGMIQTYLNRKLPEDWNDMDTAERRAWLCSDDALQAPGVDVRNRTCAAEIWCEVLGGTTKDMTTHNLRPIHDIMRKLDGWEQGKSRTIFKLYGNQVGYFRINTAVTDFDHIEKHSKN